MEQKNIEDDLVIKAITEAQEIERLAVFNGKMHDEEVAWMTRNLAGAHPDADAMRWLAVVQPSTGSIVSTLCLLPWVITYCGVSIKAAEMGIVGTDKSWRKRGYIRQLAAQFNALMAKEGYLLSHIQGIPYFYRQFGYEYAIPLETHYCLELRYTQKGGQAAGAAASGATGTKPIVMREADLSDISILQKFYQEHTATLDITTTRTEAQWKYMLDASPQTAYAADTYMLEYKGAGVGYCRISRQGFGDGLIFSECSDLPYELFADLFLLIGEMAKNRKKPYIRLNLEPSHPAVRAALDVGGKLEGGYKWQIKLPDVKAFLDAVVPVIEGRLAESEFCRFSGALSINYYRDTVSIKMAEGRIHNIGNTNAEDREVIRVPPNLLPPLLLGQQTLDECRRFYPDVAGSPRARRLFSALFPPMTGFLYPPY